MTNVSTIPKVQIFYLRICLLLVCVPPRRCEMAFASVRRTTASKDRAPPSPAPPASEDEIDCVSGSRTFYIHHGKCVLFLTNGRGVTVLIPLANTASLL